MTITVWALTVAIIAGLLAVDWFVLGRRRNQLGPGAAGSWFALCLSASVLFGIALGTVAGWNLGTQYVAGYIVEESLSIDNLFVFLLIMNRFSVPADAQPRALSVGIVLALALRTVFIALGAALLAAFSVMYLLFGLGLVASAVQLLRHRRDGPVVRENRAVAAARRWLPLTESYDGERIITRRNGRRTLTPLLLVILALAGADLVFALDSIPAVFAVTDHAYVVFAANAFALLGLRALYFLLAGLLDRLVYLSAGLAGVLGFIGLKLVLEFVHRHHAAVPELSTGLSLAVIAGVLGATALASLVKTRREARVERAANRAATASRRAT